jgi:hypothetical protein
MKEEMMAWVGISRSPCPKCSSHSTEELHRPLEPGVRQTDPANPRYVFLKCLECHHEEPYGTYKNVGNTLVKA